MKKLAAIMIVLLVAALWLMPVRRANAQSEVEQVEKEIRGLEALAEMCIGGLNLIMPPGPNALPEDLAAYEKQLKAAEECAAKIEKRLEWLRKKLGELISKLPAAVTPPEDPKRKKLREKIKEWEERVAAAEEKKKGIRERLEELLKTTRSNQPAPGFKAENTSTAGLSTTTFTTPQGRFLLHLPADIKAGETISGTVAVEPNGATEGERASSLAALNSYGMTIGNEMVLEPKTITYQGTTFTIMIPTRKELLARWQPMATLPKSGIPIVLFKSDPTKPPDSVLTLTPSELQPWWQECASGKNIRKNVLVSLFKSDKSAGRSYNLQDCFPTQWTSVNFDTSSTVQTETLTFKVGYIEFRDPAQQGHPVKITGPFDGDLRTTEIKVGGQTVTPLAESPRSCIFKSPEEKPGMTEISVKEKNVETKGTYRNLGVRLSAPKTSLLKGETTVLTVTVEGLKGIQQNVPLLLQKQGVVSMEGGDTQTVQIRPTDVRADGTFETKRTLTGLQAGAFGVTATVIDPAHRPIIIPLTENAKVNGFRVKKEGDKFVIEVAGVQSPITGKPVDGEHKLEHQCPTLSDVPYLSRLFLDNGSGKSTVNCLEIMVTARIIIQEEEE